MNIELESQSVAAQDKISMHEHQIHSLTKELDMLSMQLEKQTNHIP